MANTKRRTNISIDSRLWKRATAYSKEHDRSLSSLIEQGLRAVLDGSPPQVEQVRESTFSPRPFTGEETIDSAVLMKTIDTYLESPAGRTHVERAVYEQLANRGLLRPLPPDPDSRAVPARTSTPKASPRTRIVGARETVDVPPEVRERLGQFTALELVGATGMDRTVLTKIRSGNRSRIEKGTFDKVMAGLERLESQGA